MTITLRPGAEGNVEVAGPIAVKSAERVLDLFELLSDTGHGLTHAEIASALGIPKGSLSKLLRTMLVRDYLALDQSGRKHTLGPALRELTDRPSRVRTLIDVALPILHDLTRSLNESSALNRIRGQQAEVIATATSEQRLVSHLREGDVAPLHAVSGGKAMLAALSPDEVDDYLVTASFEKITPATVTRPDLIRAELATIRANGLAYSTEEFTPGLIGIGVGLALPASYPLCSLNLASPSVRMTESHRKDAARALLRAKRVVESRIGMDHVGPQGQPER